MWLATLLGVRLDTSPPSYVNVNPAWFHYLSSVRHTSTSRKLQRVVSVSCRVLQGCVRQHTGVGHSYSYSDRPQWLK